MSKALRLRRVRWVLGAVVAALVISAAPAMAASVPTDYAPSERSVPGVPTGPSDTSYGPVDRPGPPLSVPTATLAAALTCSANVATTAQEPVLMIPGTSTSPESSFSWNFLPAFKALGVPYCTITPPMHTDADIQISAEYVVYAIRAMHAETGKKVQILGWSQGGGPLPRWALRWWPDTRTMVDGLIGIDPPNRGTLVTKLFGCEVRSVVPDTRGAINPQCAPAIWQQTIGSDFIDALNSRAMTFDSADYTVIYSRDSNLVVPNVNGSRSSLPPGPNVSNIALQDVCPSAFATGADHGLVLGSPITYALAMDALNHPRQPADLSRIDRSVCQQLGRKYANPVTQALGITKVYGTAFLAHFPHEGVNSEPPLRCYVYAPGTEPANCASLHEASAESRDPSPMRD